jgi:hypothetical protein
MYMDVKVLGIEVCYVDIVKYEKRSCNVVQASMKSNMWYWQLEAWHWKPVHNLPHSFRTQPSQDHLKYISYRMN